MPKGGMPIEERVMGPVWSGVRAKILDVQQVLSTTDEHAAFEPSTIYVKCKTRDEPLAPVFAVIWMRSAREVVLGLATPEPIVHACAIAPPAKMKYKGLTTYVPITEAEPLPRELADWSRQAFVHASAIDPA